MTAGAVLSPAAQWEAIAASPRLVGKSKLRTSATAVVIAQKDEYAYALTAYHALADSGERECQFFTPQSYPEPSRTEKADMIAAYSKSADFALLKILAGKMPVPQVALALPGERPKRFPFDAVSIGCTYGSPPTALAEKIGDKRFARKNDFEKAFFWETAKCPEPGRSGGPLFSADGKVIGLCAAAKDGKGYYCHLDEILAVLKAEGYAWIWEGAEDK